VLSVKHVSKARPQGQQHGRGAAPQLLCLLLGVREQMREMNARLARIGAQVERIDASACCIERGGPARAPPAGDAPGPFPVAVRAQAVQLLDLPAELLVAIATQLTEDDDLAFALACRRLRQAVAGTTRRAGFRRGSARHSARWASWSGSW
jgi:hypothetical protein